MLSEVVMLESNIPKRLPDLAASIINSMWLTHKRDNYIPVCRFIKQYFRVTGHDELAAVLARDINERLVNLPLTKDL